MVDYQESKLQGSLSIKTKIRRAEQLREQGLISESLELLGKAEAELTEFLKTSDRQDFKLLYTQIISHEIICHKHRWQNFGEERYLDRMLEAVNRGLALDVPQKNKAVFYLRSGDVFTSRGEFAEAEKNYKLAYELVKDANDHTTGEYLGHYAESMVDNGKAVQAIPLLELAIQMTQRQEQIVEWHRLIIMSGLYGRLARAAKQEQRYILMLKSIWRSYSMARILAYNYGMPQRLTQFWLRIRGKGV